MITAAYGLGRAPGPRPVIRSHACHRFVVDTTSDLVWAAACSCDWRSAGWTTRAEAIEALMRHLGQ